MFNSLNGILSALENLLDKLLAARWNVKFEGSSWPEGVLHSSVVFPEIEATFYRADRFIDDVKWPVSLFYDSKEAQRKDQSAKSFGRLLGYAETSISKPTNFLKHNRTNLRSLTHVLRFDTDDLAISLPGFSFVEWGGQVSREVNRPEIGLHATSATALVWLVLAVLLRTAKDAEQFVLEKIGNRHAPPKPPSVIPLLNRIVGKLMLLHVYTYSDRVFNDNNFSIDEANLNSMNYLHSNLLFGSIYRPWTSAKKVKIDQFGELDPLTARYTVNVKRQIGLHSCRAV